MTDRLALASRLLSLGLTLVLAAYSFVAHPLHLAAAIAAATLLLVIALTITRRVFARKPAKLPDLTGLFVMVVSATCTLHTLMAREVYDPVRFIDLTPGYRLIAWTLHGLVIASVILAGPKRSSLVALGATIVYTSSLYLPIFATPEMGASFVPFLALALALLATEIFTSRPVVFPLRISSLTPLVLLGFLALIASLFSHSQSESMTWFLKLLTLGLLMLTTPLVIRTRADWKRLALLVVTMSVAVPVLLSMAKLVELSWQLGAWAILEYKMGLAELGRANLIARTLLVGVPISVALATTATRRGWRMLWWALNALALAVFATCQSWGGMIALALTVAFAGILARGARWRGWWQSRVPGTARYLLYAAALIVVVAGFLGLIQLAPQTNVGSFNGRLFQFRAAIREMLDHPLLGVGPGHSYAKSRYTTGLDWLVGTQVTRDQPLIPVYHLRRSTILHHHNLYFEIGAGIGMLGLAAFAWFLVELLRLGLNTRRRMQGTDRHLLTGCLVAIFASAAWGLLDAMRVSPPFFTFPTWALAGLVLAAPRAFGVGERQRARGEDQRTKGGTQDRMFRHRPTLLTRMSSTKARVLGPAALLLVAVVAVLLPLGGNLHYRRGFSAYQEGKWDETVEALERASRWEPLNAKYHQMRGEALINLGRYDEAAAAYERAGNLKREFAPYHAQLGWLYWLAGDLAAATSEFEKAVEIDVYDLLARANDHRSAAVGALAQTAADPRDGFEDAHAAAQGHDGLARRVDLSEDGNAVLEARHMDRITILHREERVEGFVGAQPAEINSDRPFTRPVHADDAKVSDVSGAGRTDRIGHGGPERQHHGAYVLDLTCGVHLALGGKFVEGHGDHVAPYQALKLLSDLVLDLIEGLPADVDVADAGHRECAGGADAVSSAQPLLAEDGDLDCITGRRGVSSQRRLAGAVRCGQ